MNRFLVTLTITLMLQPEVGSGQSAARDDSARVIHQNRLEHPRLGESSGLARSLRQPGVLWTLNDSGNPPDLFVIDSLGKDRGVFRVRNAENLDWEALASARCGEQECLYIADTGDNNRRRKSVRVYRVPEPATRSSRGGTIGADAVLRFEYEDGPRNVEAIFVGPGEDVYLISKEPSGPARVYRIDGSAWKNSATPVTASFVQELPVGEGLGYQVTDASMGEDGEVAVRTYRYVYFFTLHEGKLQRDRERNRCDAGGLDAQGEAITVLPDGSLATTSERVMTLGTTISIIECR